VEQFTTVSEVNVGHSKRLYTRRGLNDIIEGYRIIAGNKVGAAVSTSLLLWGGWWTGGIKPPASPTL